MGHERLGVLPKSKVWRDIVSEIGDYDGSGEHIAKIASATIEPLRERLRFIHGDQSMIAAFQFLVALSVSVRESEPRNALSYINIDLPKTPTPLSLGMALHKWVKQNDGRAEYAQLTSSAATDAIVAWQERYKDDQQSLFDLPTHPYEVWRKAGDGSGFSDLARFFFAKFTERYLNYFLEREASAELRNVADREKFDQQVALHAHETAKITQSFAAGWFNKNAVQEMPTEKQIRGFLSHALGKIREELSREH